MLQLRVYILEFLFKKNKNTKQSFLSPKQIPEFVHSNITVSTSFSNN